MEREGTDEKIKKERNEYMSKNLKQRNEEGKKKTTNSLMFYPSKNQSFSSTARDRNHAPIFTATGLIPYATDTRCCCLLNWLHMKKIGRCLFVSLVFAKLYA